MAEQSQTKPGSTNENDVSFRVEAPQLTLPKGGGALRAIAEKFSLNPSRPSQEATTEMEVCYA